MGTSRHQRIKYQQNNGYDNHVDPSTRLPFRSDEDVVFCKDKNSLISLRSLQVIGYRCPFCGGQLDSKLRVVEVKNSSEISEKTQTKKAFPSPSQNPLPRGQSVQTWLGLVLAFCLLFSVGAVVITRALQNIPLTETPDNFSQPDNNSNTENGVSESSSVPTESPTALSDEDSWIVFAYGQDQVGGSGSNTGRDLYLLNWKTGERRQLTSGNSGDNFPSFAPNGERIVYTRCSPDCQLYVKNIKTGNEEKLPGISVKAMAPNWCFINQWIVFEARQNVNRHISLWMIDLKDNKITALTDGPADSRPVWSPDCSKILFGRAIKDTNSDGLITTNDRLDIYIYDMANQSSEALLETPDADEFGFTWSPVGDLIAFTRVSEDTDGNGQITLDDQSDLFLYDIDTGRETNLTRGIYSAFSPSFSFSGKFIVFTSFEGYGSRILVYSLFDSTFTTVSGLGDYYHANWKP